MAEQAAEQTKRVKERKKIDPGKEFFKTHIEPPNFTIQPNPQMPITAESKHIGNLVKLKQLYEKYESFVDKKMLENILKDKKYNLETGRPDF